METKLTTKAQAAWKTILASGQDWVKYYSAGGVILNDGTKIHSHTVRSLEKVGLLKRVTYDPKTGLTRDAVRGWHFVVNR